jgi:uncharacterized DUF497 family protein
MGPGTRVDAANTRKHGLSFGEAKTVFSDPAALTMSDPDHSVDEERYLDLGLSAQGGASCRLTHRARRQRPDHQLPQGEAPGENAL